MTGEVYLRCYTNTPRIEPNKIKIKKGIFTGRSTTTLPGWESILGLQFQNLVLNNDIQIMKALGISGEDVVFSNPFFQRKTKEQSGCQIDLMIQTKHNCLFICEVKFSKSLISTTVIDEMKEKISRIKIPKNFSYRPVLIHVNGVSQSIIDEDYFSNIVNFGEFI